MTAPLVSIGVPVHNGAATLDRTLATLRAQTWTALEIVVCDNASTDATAEICAAHAAADPRIHHLGLTTPVEVLANFDLALQRTSGELFMWAADDDHWAPDHVARLAGALQRRPDAVLAAPRTVDVEDGNRVADHREVTDLVADDGPERVRRFIAQPEPLGKGNLVYGLIRRSVLVDIAPLRFWRADRRRLDYHLALAILCRGGLVVDDELEFEKTIDRPSPGGRFARGLTGTRRALGWIDAYVPVVAEQLPGFDRGLAHELHRLVRRRKLGLLAHQARRVLG